MPAAAETSCSLSIQGSEATPVTADSSFELSAALLNAIHSAAPGTGLPIQIEPFISMVTPFIASGGTCGLGTDAMSMRIVKECSSQDTPLIMRDLPVSLRKMCMWGVCQGPTAATDSGMVTCAMFEPVLSSITCCVSTSVTVVTVSP